MPEPQYVVAIIITGLGAVAWLMIVSWKNSWETRMAAQDSRLDRHAEKHGEHDVNHAKLSNDLQHIKNTTEEIGKDVKSLLIQSNGKRSSI